MLNRSASLAMSTSVLKALPGKLDINSPSILYIHARRLILCFGCVIVVVSVLIVQLCRDIPTAESTVKVCTL